MEKMSVAEGKLKERVGREAASRVRVGMNEDSARLHDLNGA